MAALSSIATAAIIGGAAVSAMGSAAQGQAAKAQADFESTLYKQQASQAAQVSGVNEADFRRNQSRTAGARRAALGASGIDFGTGSPLLATGDLARETELSARRIRYGGEVASQRLRQQAQLTRMAGQQSELAGYTRAGASLLSGFGLVWGT